jgi:hypothetical protein
MPRYFVYHVCNAHESPTECYWLTWDENAKGYKYLTMALTVIDLVVNHEHLLLFVNISLSAIDRD